LGKYNPYHDRRNGQFTTAEGAGGAGGKLIHLAAAVQPATQTPTNAFQDKAEQLASCLQSQADSPECLQLAAASEKARLSSGGHPLGPVEWLQSLGITDEKTILNYLFVAPATDILSQRSLKGSPSPEIISAINKYAAQYHLSPQLMLDIVAFETGGTFDPNSLNDSSAAGLFQITLGTWKGLARQYQMYHFTDPFDVDQNVHAGAINLSASAQTLAANGITEPTEAQVYLAQNQGGGGASALIKNPGMNVVDALETLSTYRKNPGQAALAVVKNGGQASMTAAQFAAVMTARFIATAKITPKIWAN
jgi:hypothetical protein